jgi:hypothetical protein
VAEGRRVDKILAEWRAVERTVADFPDSPARRALEARIACLRDEHKQAMTDREGEIAELRHP